MRPCAVVVVVVWRRRRASASSVSTMCRRKSRTSTSAAAHCESCSGVARGATAFSMCSSVHSSSTWKLPVVALLRISSVQKLVAICSTFAALASPRCSGTLAVRSVCQNGSSLAIAVCPQTRSSAERSGAEAVEPMPRLVSRTPEAGWGGDVGDRATRRKEAPIAGGDHGSHALLTTRKHGASTTHGAS